MLKIFVRCLRSLDTSAEGGGILGDGGSPRHEREVVAQGVARAKAKARARANTDPQVVNAA